MDTESQAPPARTPARGRRKANGAADENGTRERILVAAEELIALHGVEGLELKHIAQKVGIRPPSVFAHFDGLQSIVAAVGRRCAQRIMMSWQSFDIVEAPDKRLKRGVRGLVEHLANNPASARMMLRGMGGPSRQGADRERVLAMRAMVAQPINELMKLGIEAGLFRKVRTEAFMAQMLGAILVSLVFVGWDENGKLRDTISLAKLQKEAEDMAMALVGARPKP